MIANPTNDFESLENAIALQLQAQVEFQNLKNPDGSLWQVLTEDEGDIEFNFHKQISEAGLSIIVQTPTGKSTDKTIFSPGPRFIVTVPVQISEAVVFNRSEGGTKVRVQTAASVVRRSLHLFEMKALPGFTTPLIFREALRDRDRHPETGALVSSVVCTFDTVCNEASKTIS